MTGKTHSAKATVAGRVIAESDKCLVMQDTIYFPPECVDQAVLSKSEKTITYSSGHPWKGTALYYSINLEKTTLVDAAWYYPDPEDLESGYASIKNYVAFDEKVVAVESK